MRKLTALFCFVSCFKHCRHNTHVMTVDVSKTDGKDNIEMYGIFFERYQLRCL